VKGKLPEKNSNINALPVALYDSITIFFYQNPFFRFFLLTVAEADDKDPIG
jgi:hypothetical protein